MTVKKENLVLNEVSSADDIEYEGFVVVYICGGLISVLSEDGEETFIKIPAEGPVRKEIVDLLLDQNFEWLDTGHSAKKVKVTCKSISEKDYYKNAKVELIKINLSDLIP